MRLGRNVRRCKPYAIRWRDLAEVRAVDTVESNPFSAGVVQDLDCVAVEDGDDGAGGGYSEHNYRIFRITSEEGFVCTYHRIVHPFLTVHEQIATFTRV